MWGKAASTTTKNNKPKFVWSDVTTGSIASTPTGNKTVTEDATLIGGTFLMLPTDNFSATAKIVVTTNYGDYEFLLSEIVTKNPHTWESGEYINYNFTISNETYQLSATPLEWGESPVNVIFDKQYYLKLSQTKVQTAGDAATVNIEVKTNYDAEPYTGYDAGATLDLNAMEDWATVNITPPSFSEGVYTYNVNVSISEFDSDTEPERWMRFYVSAGNLRRQVSLQQWSADGVWMHYDVQLDSSDGGSGIMQRRKIVFTSGNPGWWEWKITQVEDTDNILLNTETILESIGKSGGAVYFYFKANAVTGKKATLTLSNTNGDNPPMSVILTVP